MNKVRKAASESAANSSYGLKANRADFPKRMKVSFPERTQPLYTSADHGMTDEEYRLYVATCEQSYDIMKQTFALYTQHPNALYVI